MSETPRIAAIGTGYWGRNLIRNLDALGALAGICDTSAEAHARFAELYPRARLFADIAAALADDDIDGVAIATPATTHGELTAMALAAGKHVFVEKPLCLDLAEGRRLAEDARERGLTLMVGHLLLYHPAFLALADLVRNGGLGELRYVYSNRLSLGRIRREENVLWDLAPHDISMILALAGRMPRRVTTGGGVYVNATVAATALSQLEFDNGLQGHIFVSWLHPYKDHRMVVVGEKGMAVFHDSMPGADKLVLYRHRIGWNRDLPEVTEAEGEPIPYGPDEPLELECRHFLDCVAARRQPRSDAREALRVLAVLSACQDSLMRGAPVEIGDAP